MPPPGASLNPHKSPYMHATPLIWINSFNVCHLLLLAISPNWKLSQESRPFVSPSKLIPFQKKKKKFLNPLLFKILVQRNKEFPSSRLASSIDIFDKSNVVDLNQLNVSRFVELTNFLPFLQALLLSLALIRVSCTYLAAPLRAIHYVSSGDN